MLLMEGSASACSMDLVRELYHRISLLNTSIKLGGLGMLCSGLIPCMHMQGHECTCKDMHVHVGTCMYM